MRVILYTGKGGVGKTTVAAATALRLARSGQRTLVLSTDPAHSLGDSLATPLGNEPVAVAENLDGAEIDALAENDKAWESLRDYLGRVLTRGTEATLASEEMLLLPGLGELFSLLRILDFAESGAYDTLVVDCAPTGETLSLLNYPERLEHLFELALPAKRAMVKAIGRPLEKLTSIPMPEDRLFDDVMGLLGRLTRLGKLLRDGEVTSMRIVTTPERIVVAEARRAHSWLSMYGFTVDQVVVNRVYPDAALAGYFAPFAASQAAGLARIEESFGYLPILRLGLQDTEVVGLEALAVVGEALYSASDPAAIHYRGEFARVVRVDGETQLRLRLPDADKAQLDLREEDGDVIVGYRNERHRVALPDSLAGRTVSRARYAGDELVVTLAEAARTA